MTMEIYCQEIPSGWGPPQPIRHGAIERAVTFPLCVPTLTARCTEIADQVVARYKQAPYPSCTGHAAKRWQAAWDGACIALGGDPAEYRG
jgi:hypothetical protein